MIFCPESLGNPDKPEVECRVNCKQGLPSARSLSLFGEMAIFAVRFVRCASSGKNAKHGRAREKDFAGGSRLCPQQKMCGGTHNKIQGGIYGKSAWQDC